MDQGYAGLQRLKRKVLHVIPLMILGPYVEQVFLRAAGVGPIAGWLGKTHRVAGLRISDVGSSQRPPPAVNRADKLIGGGIVGTSHLGTVPMEFFTGPNR
jgi:hypothetical protein